jgi:hypothetical protein
VCVLVCVAVFLAAWDVVAALNDVEGDTFSEVLRDAVLGGEAPPWILTLIVGFALGILVGHLWWPQKPPERT